MEYQTHVKHMADIQENKPLVLTIRDLTPGIHKYIARVVRAQVSRSSEALAKWDRLWVYSVVGNLDPQPWGVKVVEELGITTPGKPYSDIFDALSTM